MTEYEKFEAWFDDLFPSHRYKTEQERENDLILGWLAWRDGRREKAREDAEIGRSVEVVIVNKPEVWSKSSS